MQLYFPRRAVNKEISQICEQFKVKIKQQLSHTTDVSVTVDIWTDRKMRGYIAVTGHHINSGTKALETVLLSCERFVGRFSLLSSFLYVYQYMYVVFIVSA